MLLRRALRIPRVLGWAGTTLMLVSALAIGLFADSHPTLTLALALPPLCLGCGLCGRADAIVRERAQLAATSKRIERELSL